MPLLSRDFDERKALIRGLINALIRNETIETTEAKARAMVGHIDKLITKAKKGTQHSFRLVNAFLNDEENSKKLSQIIAPALRLRKGGYTRVTKLGIRKGDNATIVRVEFSDKPSRSQPQTPTPVAKPPRPPKSVQKKASPTSKSPKSPSK